MVNSGIIFNCLLVRFASSIASSRPRIVTITALSFIWWGIVMIWVFAGSRFDEISSPAIMLPQARRLIGLIAVSGSVVGVIVAYRGCPIRAKKIIRKL